MAQAEANLRIRNMTGYSVESNRTDTDNRDADADDRDVTAAPSSTISNLRFTYPGTGSRPQPELPERRMLLIGGGGGSGSGVGSTNNSGVNNHSNTGELASSSRTSSSSASSFLLVGDSNSGGSNHGLNDPSSNHRHHSSSMNGGGGGGSNHIVSSNRPIPKEASFPSRLANDRYDQPPRPLEVEELCQGVVIADNDDDDENDHFEYQRDRDGDVSGHDITPSSTVLPGQAHNNQATPTRQEQVQTTVNGQVQQLTTTHGLDHPSGGLPVVPYPLRSGRGDDLEAFQLQEALRRSQDDLNHQANNGTTGQRKTRKRGDKRHRNRDTTPGFGSNSNSNSSRSVHDHGQHDSNGSTINRSSVTMSVDQHHNHQNHSYHVVPCLSCRSRLRVNVLASLVSCPKCNTVNPAIGNLDNNE